MRQRILGNPDQRPHQRAAHRLPLRDRVVDRHQQRQIDQIESAEVQRKQRLQAQRQQRNHNINDQGNDFVPTSRREDAIRAMLRRLPAAIAGVLWLGVAGAGFVAGG